MKIEIETSNAAFEDHPSAETARILRELAHALERGEAPTLLRDINGNVVGVVERGGE